MVLGEALRDNWALAYLDLCGNPWARPARARSARRCTPAAAPAAPSSSRTWTCRSAVPRSTPASPRASTRSTRIFPTTGWSRRSCGWRRRGPARASRSSSSTRTPATTSRRTPCSAAGSDPSPRRADGRGRRRRRPQAPSQVAQGHHLTAPDVSGVVTVKPKRKRRPMDAATADRLRALRGGGGEAWRDPRRPLHGARRGRRRPRSRPVPQIGARGLWHREGWRGGRVEGRHRLAGGGAGSGRGRHGGPRRVSGFPRRRARGPRRRRVVGEAWLRRLWEPREIPTPEPTRWRARRSIRSRRSSGRPRCCSAASTRFDPSEPRAGPRPCARRTRTSRPLRRLATRARRAAGRASRWTRTRRRRRRPTPGGTRSSGA